MRFQSRLSWGAAVSVVLGMVAGVTNVAAADEAADYPNKPVPVIVAYTPGGANDIVARLYANELSQYFDEGFVVENRAGASGITGTDAAARADADGYTLLLGAGGTMTMNPALFKDLPYDPIESFDPVGQLAGSPLVLVVPPDSPATNVAELLAHARQQNQPLSFASPGTGTPLHLAGELFARSADIELLHVPYKGSTPALNDLMAGRTDMMFDVMGSSMELVRGDRLRALGVTSLERSPQLPDIPTIAEQGIDGFDVTSWFGFFVPQGTPRPIIDKLNEAIQVAARSDAVAERLLPMGMMPISSTPEELREHVAREKEKWGTIAKEAGLEPQ